LLSCGIFYYFFANFYQIILILVLIIFQIDESPTPPPVDFGPISQQYDKKLKQEAERELDDDLTNFYFGQEDDDHHRQAEEEREEPPALTYKRESESPRKMVYTFNAPDTAHHNFQGY
jgi:hypothetical protein